MTVFPHYVVSCCESQAGQGCCHVRCFETNAKRPKHVHSVFSEIYICENCALRRDKVESHLSLRFENFFFLSDERKEIEGRLFENHLPESRNILQRETCENFAECCNMLRAQRSK